MRNVNPRRTPSRQLFRSARRPGWRNGRKEERQREREQARYTEHTTALISISIGPGERGGVGERGVRAMRSVGNGIRGQLADVFHI